MQITITNAYWFLWLIIPVILLFILASLLIVPVFRYVTNKIVDDILSQILSDTYTENMIELFPSIKRFSFLNLIEMSLRAEEGEIIKRPLGSPKHLMGFDSLFFSPRQMAATPLSAETPIDMRTILGPNAQKPLVLSMPLMIAGMGYGVALSEEAKIALAIAATNLDTATNSGEGPFLPEEAEAADKLVLQICRWSWGLRTLKQIQCSDMLEVQMGQGADLGSSKLPPEELQGRAQKLGGIAEGESPLSLPLPSGVQTAEDWPIFVKKLRIKAGGIPIALKLMATNRLEEDLAIAMKAGFDVIVLDGTMGGSHGTPPIKQDDFGIPIIYALVRAKQILHGTGISLVVCGGFFTPGECLKALALGADAIGLGTVPLLALAHNQTTKVVPWKPPTNLVYYSSADKTKLDIKKAATSVTNVFASMVLEMREAMQSIGKSSLKELSPDDLVALDTITSDITGVKLVTLPQKQASRAKDFTSGPQANSNMLQDLNITLKEAYIVKDVMEKMIEELRRPTSK